MTTATIALAVYIQITLAVKFPIVRTQYSARALSSISCVYIRQGWTAHAHTPTHTVWILSIIKGAHHSCYF